MTLTGTILAIDEAYLPVTLTVDHPMTDEEFVEFCEQYPDYRIEVTAEGEILVMAPNFSLSGAQGARVIFQLDAWAVANGKGLVLDAQAGFVLPNGARRSPDISWVSKSRIGENLDGFWHLCPDFIIEIRSKSDRLRVLRAKMHEWTDNGAELAWLIDPERKAVEIYRPGGEPQILENVSTVAGEGPVDGFHLDLQRVWNPLG